jgi:DNA-binding NarL/FixJ family response regulator
MPPIQKVFLYGNSLLLSGVAYSLAQQPDLQVVQATHDWPDAAPRLEALQPSVIIFDLTSQAESHFLPMLVHNPGLLLVGLDPEHSQAVMLSGQTVGPLTLDRMIQIIERN